jgi:hypothetical protein
LRAIQVGTRKNHINTVASIDGNIWCLLHNLGPSILVRINPKTGSWLDVYTRVGEQSHGIVPWLDGFLVLSSGEGSLIHVTQTETRVLWTDPDRKFLKGLHVDRATSIAFFGISDVTPRTQRGSVHLNCELASFDLLTETLLTRTRVETRGLLNTIN